MKALQYRKVGAGPEIVEVETPEPGPGQVRIEVRAAGVCHSDDHLMSLPEEQFSMGLPLTLGHEGAGVVDKLGAGVRGVELGTPVAVYGAWGCGRCYRCALGEENYCTGAAALQIRPPGLGSPGAMAEHLIVDDARHLVPLGDLDPVENVSLTDAGLTPYHAIKGSLAKLVPGSTAVVIGTGGLGHLAIQIIRALSPARVVAFDIEASKLTLASDVGAHETVLSGEASPQEVRGLVASRGVEAVFDFVVTQSTVELGSALVGVGGDLVLVGVGAATLRAGLGAAPYDSSVRAPYWGSLPELFEVIELARAGLIHVVTERFSLDEGRLAYERLHDGTLRGRAVLVP